MDAPRAACHAWLRMGKCGLALALVGLALWACGSRTELYGGPVGDDASEDAGIDAAPDTGPDAEPDAGPDASDASVDAEPDAAPDAEPDATIDAEPDATLDAEPDVIEPEPELELDCPKSLGDERLPYGFVGAEFVMDGADFVSGEVAAWSWSVVPEKCDELLPVPRYDLIYPQNQVTHFRPARPGSYHMVLTVTAPDGETKSCEFGVPVQGRGLRVELCWDTSTSTDLDLYVHEPNDDTPWFLPGYSNVVEAIWDSPTCNGVTCVSSRNDGLPAVYSVDWGYDDSPLEFCDRYSSEIGFIDAGFCPNPRASTDNNLHLSSGSAEVVQLDNPNDGDRFRIMVQNFSNKLAEPRVYVYCARAEATFLSPGTPPDFVAPGGGAGGNRFGTMWRPGDVEMWVNDEGATVGCEVDPLYLNGDRNQGPDVTIDDPSF